MTERFALYYAPAANSPFAERAAAWLARPELAPLTVSARRYGFHATLKAPMELGSGVDRAALESRLADFAREHAPVPLGRLEPRLLDGFLALVPAQQSAALGAFAANVVRAFEPLRAPLSAADRERRLAAPLSDRQRALLECYGYPYVLEQFQFHMTLTDRLDEGRRLPLRDEAAHWFAGVLAAPVLLDRLVLFAEERRDTAFARLADYPLGGDR